MPEYLCRVLWQEELEVMTAVFLPRDCANKCSVARDSIRYIRLQRSTFFVTSRSCCYLSLLYSSRDCGYLLDAGLPLVC